MGNEVVTEIGNTEEVLCKGFDSGWNRMMPVTLITYKDGSQDIHLQSGPDFEKRLAMAEPILKARGLRLADEKWCWGSTGGYRSLVKV